MNEARPLSQSLRLLELVKSQPFTTLDARRMGIMNPAQRISELCKRGHPIDTIKTRQTDEHGHTHCVAMYVGIRNIKGRPIYGNEKEQQVPNTQTS